MTLTMALTTSLKSAGVVPELVEHMRRGVRTSLLLLLGAAGCGDGSLDPLPLEVTLEAGRTAAAPEETIAFVVNARGGSLVGVEIDYGDGGAAVRSTSGARTARVTFEHAYAAAGVYAVRATVTDAVAGTKEAGLEIRIQ